MSSLQNSKMPMWSGGGEGGKPSLLGGTGLCQHSQARVQWKQRAPQASLWRPPSLEGMGVAHLIPPTQKLSELATSRGPWMVRPNLVFPGIDSPDSPGLPPWFSLLICRSRSELCLLQPPQNLGPPSQPRGSRNPTPKRPPACPLSLPVWLFLPFSSFLQHSVILRGPQARNSPPPRNSKQTASNFASQDHVHGQPLLGSYSLHLVSH